MRRWRWTTRGGVAEGGTLNQAAPGLLTNDSDPETDPLTVTTTPVSAPLNGHADPQRRWLLRLRCMTAAQPPRDSFVYQVCDTEPLCDTATVNITITGGANTPPTVTITSPSGGSSFIQGDGVSFAGTAGDAEEGDLTVNLLWTSDIDGAIGSSGSFSTTSLSVGAHTITAMVTDGGGLIGSAQVGITVNLLAEIRISASSDDAEERAAGNVSLTSSDIELVFDGAGDQTIGLRFNNVQIPQGAGIASASVQFQADEINTVATSLTIRGEDVDNALTFVNSTGNISSRPTTAAAAGWSPVAWTTVNEAGPDQQTPDIASVIQEIVNRSGWSSGNSLVIIITGTGERTAESYDGVTSSAPLLHVEYGSTQQPPTVDAGPDQMITLPSPANLDGTVSDDGLPDPPAQVNTLWSKESGPGTVSFAVADAEDTTATFSAPGAYVLRLTADDGSLTNFDEVIITVVGAGGETTIEVSVSSKSDDAEEGDSGNVSLSSSDLELVFDQSGGNQTVGIRFNGLDIPQNATIVNAFVQFQADDTNTVATSLTIRGEAVDNAATFARDSLNISSRTTTSAGISWAPAPWTTVGEAGPDQQTSDLAPVVQEIVNRPGWSSGNSLVVIITGTGEREAESYNGNQNAAPVLHVQYTTGQ